MAASRVLRLRALLPRAVSVWTRKSATRSASMSSTVSLTGGLLCRALAYPQQQPERIAIARDRMSARLHLDAQPVGEEALDQRRQGDGAHWATSPPLGGRARHRQIEQFRYRFQVPVRVRRGRYDPDRSSAGSSRAPGLCRSGTSRSSCARRRCGEDRGCAVPGHAAVLLIGSQARSAGRPARSCSGPYSR